jgi:hypothetical protein
VLIGRNDAALLACKVGQFRTANPVHSLRRIRSDEIPMCDDQFETPNDQWSSLLDAINVKHSEAYLLFRQSTFDLLQLQHCYNMQHLMPMYYNCAFALH